MDRLSMRITGVVQGVGYRAWTQRLAGELGISGSVRNLADGTVEIHASGDRSRLNQMLDMCREGPYHAKVTAIDSRWSTGPALGPGFSIQR